MDLGLDILNQSNVEIPHLQDADLVELLPESEARDERENYQDNQDSFDLHFSERLV